MAVILIVNTLLKRCGFDPVFCTQVLSRGTLLPHPSLYMNDC
jgi:hypothetical protein